MRTFRLHREEDETNISGTGYVAEGVEFTDGRVAMRWTVRGGPRASTGLYDSIQDVKEIHGHEGKTKIEWTHKASADNPFNIVYAIAQEYPHIPPYLQAILAPSHGTTG